jgi:hypothetical protein
MKTERTDVEFPLWRKKVDSSLFRHNGTTVPKWACRMWNLESTFPGLKGKKDEQSAVTIKFNRKQFSGHITCTWPTARADKVYRLWFGDDLKNELKEVFLMSFMRDIEGQLRSTESDIEKDIPFWEFLDIEFDEATKTVAMYAHYRQEPVFRELFRRLAYSPSLKRIDDELEGKAGFRIHKQDWKPREEFETEIGAENVIYMLADTQGRELYVGEAKNMIRRFRAGHPTIKNWNVYRYDVLPSTAASYRIALERMVIRNMASILANSRGIPSLEISEYRLTNDKIDL